MTGVIVGGNASTRHVTNCGANFLGTLTLIDSLHCPFLVRAAAKPQARKVNITKYYSFFCHQLPVPVDNRRPDYDRLR